MVNERNDMDVVVFMEQKEDSKTRKTEKYNPQTIPEVPIWRKSALTIREAAAYSNIGINKIENLARTPNCPFVLYVGTKRLIKREAFDEFIRQNLVI